MLHEVGYIEGGKKQHTTNITKDNTLDLHTTDTVLTTVIYYIDKPITAVYSHVSNHVQIINKYSLNFKQ